MYLLKVFYISAINIFCTFPTTPLELMNKFWILLLSEFRNEWLCRSFTHGNLPEVTKYFFNSIFNKQMHNFSKLFVRKNDGKKVKVKLYLEIYKCKFTSYVKCLIRAKFGKMFFLSYSPINCLLENKETFWSLPGKENLQWIISLFIGFSCKADFLFEPILRNSEEVSLGNKKNEKYFVTN